MFNAIIGQLTIIWAVIVPNANPKWLVEAGSHIPGNMDTKG